MRYCLYAIVGIAAAVVLVLLGYESFWTKDGEAWHMSIFAGSVLLTIGWIVSTEVTINSARKRHTIDLITYYIFNPQRTDDRTLIKRYLPRHVDELNNTIVDFNDETHELTTAVDRELNFFEFLAIGINRGDLDDDLAKRCLKSIFCNFHDQVEHYIEHWRNQDNTTWEHLGPLCKKWLGGSE